MTDHEFATFLRRIESRLRKASPDAAAAAGFYLADPHDAARSAADVIDALLDERPRRVPADPTRRDMDDAFWRELRDAASDSYDLREALREIVHAARAADEAEEEARRASQRAYHARQALRTLKFERTSP